MDGGAIIKVEEAVLEAMGFEKPAAMFAFEAKKAEPKDTAHERVRWTEI